MTADQETKTSLFFTKACTLFAATALLICLIAPAVADDLDPFQFETGKWMSFNRYKDDSKKSRDATPESTTDSQNQTETPSSDAPPVASTEEQQTTIVKAAQPSRPVDLPVMPGVNMGYNIQVGSTEDDEKSSKAEITNLDTTPDLSVDNKNWQTRAEASQQLEQAERKNGAETEKQDALNIRLSYLPNPKINPVVPPQKPKNHGRPTPKQIAAAKSQEAQPVKKSPGEIAACAAIDAYKKEQLEAIQSDQKTLTALQQAISQLGLEKQLNFMPGSKGGDANAHAENTSPKIDTPTASQ